MPGKKQSPFQRDPRVSLARALSKLGVCSRREAEDVIRAGRVRLDDRVVRDPATRVDLDRDRIAVDDAPREPAEHIYLALNKPRGLVTTRHDAAGRDTVYTCLDASIPFVSPVGRLDRASEGLLLFTNDTRWAARLLDPASHVDKTYHVQIDRVADESLLGRLRAGVDTPEGERLAAKGASVLRSGGRTSWLEIVLDEGRNRHIRRMLGALDAEVLRLVRVAIGPLVLGTLAKGAYRRLTDAEVASLGRASGLVRAPRGSASPRAESG